VLAKDMNNLNDNIQYSNMLYVAFPVYCAPHTHTHTNTHKRTSN